MTATNWTHEFKEAGNGYPQIGEEVIGDCGGEPCLLKVVEVGTIQTRQWAANSIALVCEDADRSWDDLSEAEQDEMYRDAHHVDTIGHD